MILIADSGATKTDWRVVDNEGKIKQAKTQGFNPYYQGFEEIRDEIQNKLLDQVGDAQIDQIYFYGAGCSTTENCDVIKGALKHSFPDAEIEVNHDLLAAARALCGHEEGIACILGTGSNSCLYDGRQIKSNVQALGFILGDEGSGAHLGKLLLSDYIRNNMPDELKMKIDNKFKLDRESIIDRIYNQDRPSRFAASFSKFIFDNIRNPYMYRLVYGSFTDFFECNILRYENYQSLKVHFTGGVAFYFNEILRQVASDKAVVLQNIVENPISGLTLYHQGT